MSFHVPEAGRDTVHPTLGSNIAYGNNGVFYSDSPEPGWKLVMICSDEGGWEHVSVHALRQPRGPGRRKTQTQTRVPTWKEMCYIKNVCWDSEDVVMQLHPRKSEYVNCHPYVLHLWRPVGLVIPTPPLDYV